MIVKPTPLSTYQPQLDGLRGLAILMVFFHHASLYLPYYADWGQMGVRIFFVLSGYLITLSLWKQREAHQTDGTSWNRAMGWFHTKRIARLLPAFWLLLAAGFLLGIEDMTEYWLWHAAFLSNFLFLDLGYWHGTTAHLWTLALQEQFYVIWPFVVFFLPRRWFPAALLTMVMVAWLFRATTIHYEWSPFARWVMLPGALDAFAIGGLLAWLKKSRQVLPALPGGNKGVLLAAGAVALWFFNRWLRIQPSHPLISALPELLEGLCAAYLILGTMAGWKGLLGWLFERQSLQTIGRISYGIFIYHLLVMALLEPAFEQAGLGPKQNAAVWGASTLCVTLALAYASYRWLEQPLMKLVPHLPAFLAGCWRAVRSWLQSGKPA